MPSDQPGPTPAEIAGRLTKAQCRFMTAQRPVTIEAREFDALFGLGLICGDMVQSRFSALGLAVRAEIEREGGADGR